MRKIPVTNDFNKTQPIGFLMLRDDVEILPDAVFEIAYTVVEVGLDKMPTRIKVHEIGLCYKPVEATIKQE